IWTGPSPLWMPAGSRCARPESGDLSRGRRNPAAISFFQLAEDLARFQQRLVRAEEHLAVVVVRVFEYLLLALERPQIFFHDRGKRLGDALRAGARRVGRRRPALFR